MLCRAKAGSSEPALADPRHADAEWRRCGPSIRRRPPQSGSAPANIRSAADCAACFQAIALHCVRSSRWKRKVPAASATRARAKGAPAATTMRYSPGRCRRPTELRPRKATSLRSSSQQHNLDGLEHDKQVQTEGGVLDVEKVVLQFFA